MDETSVHQFFVETTIQSLYMHRIWAAGGATMKKLISVI